MVPGVLDSDSPVTVCIADEVIPTYLPAPPDKNPMFLEKRVYQGSSGRVYPLPFTDRIAERTGRSQVEGRVAGKRISPGPGAAGNRRAHPRRPGQDQRLRPHLPPAGHQARAGRAGRAVDFRRHRIQLAAAPSARRPSCRWISKSKNTPTARRPSGAATTIRWRRMKGMHGVCLHPGKACWN